MIKKPNNYDNVEVFERLPVGGYIVKILGTKVIDYQWGSVLVLNIDIEDGQYAGYYEKQYRQNTADDKKWKGNFRINLPKDDGTEQDSYKIRNLKVNIQAIEDSNPQFHWDWDETKLKGLTVGALFGNTEWENNGRTGWYTECRRLVAKEKIENDNYTMPNDKPIINKQTANLPSGFEELSADDLPF